MRTLLPDSSPIQLIATPGSGNGRALAAALRLREALEARGHRAALEVFPDLDALGRWAARDRSRFSLLVCVGGDGTLDTAALAAVRRSVPFLAVGRPGSAICSLVPSDSRAASSVP
jgi:diacylglycerol kinase family enzyme